MTDEILRLDPDNKMALYRRAKAISMPINASVEDYQLALEDLAKMNSTEQRVLSEIERLKKAIAVNRKREKQTYGKMFFADRKSSKSRERAAAS